MQVGFIPNTARRVTFALITLRHVAPQEHGHGRPLCPGIILDLSSIDPTCIISGGCLSLIFHFCPVCFEHPFLYFDVAKAYPYHHIPFYEEAQRNQYGGNVEDKET
jgi:hypothetical protein